MLGGDRSAVYELKNGTHDFRPVWRAMAKGLADGTNDEDIQDGKADYSNVILSFHPRKWAPNSSAWFHNDEWLTFNSIQDTPYDQIKSIPYDYNLKPVKPTWLFEGRYEGATSAWAVRYQAYQTSLDGGFGCTYGSENNSFPENWRELMDLPGAEQMGYLYEVIRGIWTDKEYTNRIPAPDLIKGNRGDTKGDGMTVNDGDGGGNKAQKGKATSDRITAMRDKKGKWAIIYIANGRDVTLDPGTLDPGRMNAYWFNPRNGSWQTDKRSYRKQTPFIKNLKTDNKEYHFDPPGKPGPGNDWVLILRN
jgi:hypothetical protein